MRPLAPAPPRRSMVRRISYVVGAVIAGSGVAMLPAAVTSAIYGEWHDFRSIVLSSVITVLIGLFLWRVVGRRGEELSTKEGFAIVGIAWFAMAAVGALPYLLSGSIGNITDAFFETASGYTTTGASILPDPASLGHGLLLWRALTQWIGGMGIIVLSIAILPLLGVGGVQLARAEAPGPTPDRLTPRFSETAKRLWYLYTFITFVEMLLLWAGEMTLFESIAHSLTTMSTGGFGTDVGSMNAFGAYSQWVVIVFMFIAGASFTVHYKAMRSPKKYWDSFEFRVYAFITIGAIVVVVGGLAANAGWSGTNVRDGIFTSVSLITTTGFGTADFAGGFRDSKYSSLD